MAKDSNFDYNKMDNSHYTVPSMYGKMVREQYNQIPKYCEPSKADGKMQGEKSNKQAGA